MSDIWQKLNLKDEQEILVCNAPESFEKSIKKLEAVRVHRDPSDPAAITFLLAFVTEQEEIERLARAIGKKAEGDAKIWFGYPKGSSKRYKCDFNRDTGWLSLGTIGFEPVRQVAIDEDWSAIRFRRVEFIKTMKRSSKGAITEEGKARTRR